MSDNTIKPGATTALPARVGRSTLRRSPDLEGAHRRAQAAARKAARTSLADHEEEPGRSPSIIAALIAVGNEAMRGPKERFEVEGHWLGNVENSPFWYVFWYDQKVGYNRKATLRTIDENVAKRLIVELVLQGGASAIGPMPDMPVVLAVELYLLDPKRDASWASTSATLLRGLAAAAADVTIGSFNGNVQRTLIQTLYAGVSRKKGMGVGSIANCMILVKAVINWACSPSPQDATVLCPRTPLPVIYLKQDIADILDVPVPEPRNWHPTFEVLGALLRLISDDIQLVRFCFIMLAYASRADAAASATGSQIDLRNDAFHLNPKGRRQQRNKYRPSLALSPSFLAETQTWREEVWVGETVPDLRDRLKAASKALGIELEDDIIPSCFRDFMATALRSAYVRYGIPFVPDQQVEMWMGHRHKGINSLYGKFGPEYLLLARNAVECVLHELDELSGGVLFRGARAAGTLPAEPVVIDPADLRRAGRRDGWAANSAKIRAGAEDVEGDKFIEGPIQFSAGERRRRWGRAVVLGPQKGIPGHIRLSQGEIRQITVKPERGKGVVSPADLLQRLEEAGYRVFEQLPDPEVPNCAAAIFISAATLQILTDEEAQRLTNAGTKWKRD